ncbi:DNA-directed RNA polymerase subunit beta [candidate division KSB1 bacterium]|nr:DNA-directed RNA polymerase subunit beta [candidate division KSB1 bacterium]
MGDNKRKRISFSKISEVIELPDLLDVQLKSFHEFMQSDIAPEKRKNIGLQAVFNTVFPIMDTRENYLLEFVAYFLEQPKYSVDECQERGVTFSVPLKAKLRLSMRDEMSESKEYTDTIEQVVYLGNMPMMTERGTFVINGAERTIVSQLHRSPGAFFSDAIHPNGTKIFSARIIPLRGSWVEFTTDINEIMYVYIDRRKKFPVTTLLRALGYSSDREILSLFSLIETIQLDDINLDSLIGRMCLDDVIDKETGELIVEREAVLEKQDVERLIQANIEQINVVNANAPYDVEIIINTIKRDPAKSEAAALEVIYRQLRSGDAPDLETARSLVDRLFFNPKRYDLGNVGRYRLNKKLLLNVDESVTVLTKDDIIAIIKFLMEMRAGKRTSDDIDHLGNRRIRTVGEQLSAQMSVGLSRMARTIKERMNLRENENLTPQDLVNARTILSVINTFFGTSQLSQFMDQTNPLAELTHKRRLSALGPGGLTRDRAGFEVRDVHYTHYGRLCPIETPEGPNIGLISSLTTYAKVNEFGFIETPYRKVNEGVTSAHIEYMSADDEEDLIIAQANAPLDEKGKFVNPRVKSRVRGDFPIVAPEELHYMDVSPNQIVSAAAALIPFLEHDDANRALMGSNMQRQAVPLLRPKAPYVGTGIEGKVAQDSRAMIVAKHEGTVVEVDAKHVVVKKDLPALTDDVNDESLLNFDEIEYDSYRLTKFHRTNQDTCINQVPIVNYGQKVVQGDVLADGCATEKGELALGRNVLVAFMPWRGYNYEDAIVISERVIKEDVYTSIHIEEFELQVRDTKRGEEELTREIPNVSEDATKDLDENGIIRIGAEVKPGDILVGKVTPKGETDPTPEEKLLKAIFGEKAGDVKDASLKAPPGLKGTVIDTKLFSRKKKDTRTKKEDKKALDMLNDWLEREKVRIHDALNQKCAFVLTGKTSAGIREKVNSELIVGSGVELNSDILSKIDFEQVDVDIALTTDGNVNDLIIKIYDAYQRKLVALEDEFEREKFKIMVGDDLPPGIVQLAKVYVAKKRKLMVGDKMAGRHGNKGVVSKIVPAEDMPYLADGTPVDIVLNPLGVPSRMNLGQIFETNLGWAAHVLGINYATPVFDGASHQEVLEEMEKAGLPRTGKTVLYDGRTGEAFDSPVTVGYIYILKLSHLVEDKIHARSIGPYSLITQQPLGGKAQFGGQRFGEMEVWALEAYGAAHTLQEILTVKSDDVRGRSKVYEAIVKGENLPEPGLPESFNVLIRELQGLGLDIGLLEV